MTVSGETLRDNVVVELTPVGRGAVAVALVVGPDAMRLVDASFRAARGRSIENAPVDRILFGRWGGPAGEELVVCRRAADRVEIHCHGGVAAVAGVIQTLTEQGCGHVSWQEWLLRDSGDPIRASAQIALAEAPTARTAAILLDQFHGALASEIRIARDATASGEWSQAATKIDAILANRNVGAHLTTPWRVVLAGAPNVGKSSLINALAGYERAIVSPLPGTTRDVVSTCTAIDGWPVELADTAGLRATNDPLESAGIALATSAASDADLVLIVEDARHFTLAALAEPQPVLSAERYVHVWNKIDLVAERPPEADSGATDRQLEYRSVFTSAVTGEGIATLIDAITATLVSAPPAAGAAVPFTEAQVEALEGASAAIARRDGAAACQALQALLAS